MALRLPVSVVRNPVYGSPARLRVERDVARRSNAPVVITTLLSLLVVGVAVAAVAYLVLRSPSSTVDSAERLEPVGTALPAPSEPPTLPTPVPTSEPDSEAQPEPTAVPVELDDDPFNIFDDEEGSGIAPAQNDALERARALQGGGGQNGNPDRDNDNPVVVPAPV